MRCIYPTILALLFAWTAAATALAAANSDKPADPSADAEETAATSESAADQLAEASPVPAIDPEDIEAWTAQLDDDLFAVRESAQQQLAAAGTAALAKVGEAAAGGSLERSTRAVNILLGWSQSSDPELSLGALEQLANLKNRPSESAMASQRLADVREAAALKSIIELGGGVNVDRQLAAFNGPAPAIQIVIGPQWKGGVEGLRHLRAVRRASTVSFHSSTIGEEAVGQLAPLTQLQRIEFYGVEISPEAITKLKTDLPQVAVEVRSGARLGIAGPHNVIGAPNAGVGAQVSQVLPGSAAAKAGILQGDIITHIADSEVKDFEHLTREIAKCEPGQSVTLKVLRQAPPGQPPQTLDITVTFDRWGDEAPEANPALAIPGSPDPLGMLQRGLPRRVELNNRR